ncbi:MAG: exodeoxyribonuclease VII small subunit [Gammaproteobacteria bacterium CG22_combo_CG10-13_8_21_14_all_40_8]|nr:MAG: exodeoxyribonuclease VII small subunit [Gammaproteobacteria bacterium CG22_combo_CG10-13_8_21_14_all_40_8]
MTKSKPIVHFEKQLAELESLVTRMEQGDLSLSDSLSAFEKGVNLTSACLETLHQAELKISQLQSLDKDAELADFPSND